MTKTTTPERPAEPGIEQLELLPAVDVPVQLRLSQRTRRIGLAGVARARAILEEQASRRAPLPTRGRLSTPPARPAAIDPTPARTGR
jgi:hypothetical protein